MEAFGIICNSCTAKLKVRDASLVGQKLACPKCGVMLTVVAPEGWTPPPPKTSGPSDSDFDDIDSILQQSSPDTPTRHRPNQSASAKKKAVKQNKPAAARQSKKSTAGKGKLPSERPAPRPAPSAPDSETVTVDTAQPPPILPNENWTADSTKSRQRLLMMLAAVIGGVILLIAGIFALTANQRGNTDPVAVSDTNDETDIDNDAVNDNEPEIESQTDDPDAVNSSTNDDGDTAASTGSGNSADVPKTEIEIEPETPAVETGSTTSNANDSAEPPTTPDPPKPPAPESAENQNTPPKQAIPSFDDVFNDVLNSAPADSEKLKTNFDDLSAALEDSNTTISELNQFASIKRKQVGIPKYFVDKNVLEKPKTKSQGLQLPLLAARYEQQTLTEIIHEIEQFTATPITLDANALNRVGFDFSARVDTTLQDAQSFANLLETIIAQINEDAVLKYAGGTGPAIITTKDASSPKTATFTLPELNGMTEEDMAKLLRDLIAADSWGQDLKVEIKDGQILATNLPHVLDQLNDFAEKWQIAIANVSDTAAVQLRLRFNRSADSLAKPVDLALKYPDQIRQFFGRLEEQTGNQFLIDFDSLSSSGWTPRSIIPAGVSEPNVEALLEEICHSMQITYRVINENTFEILSVEAEKQRRDVEFHNCSKILAGPLTADQVVELLRQSLQSAGFTTADMRAFFARDIECFIVVAPQSIQRAIDSILSRLAEL